MNENEFTLGQIAIAGKVSRGKILSVMKSIGIKGRPRTKGKWRYLSQDEARQVLEKVEAERETRNNDLRDRILGTK